VAGIAVDAEAVGADRLTIHPKRIGAIDRARATYRSIRGPVTSDWQRTQGEFRLDVAIPVGASATVCVPAKRFEDVTEGGRPVRDAEGVACLRLEGGTACFRVGSGTYRFVSTAPAGK
jgi:alpha-L-rhamnosidase